MGAFETLEPEDPQQVGRYKIVARLGSGGMGRVYLARSPGGRPVAVKVVRPELATNDEFRRRFKREVAAAQRVNGAFTAGVVDADPDGFPAWLATVYVPGLSLGEAITAHGPWPPRSVLPLAAGLLEALEVIHAAGVIHRDLKPSNVLLAADGPRIIDFGISVAMEASLLTRPGMRIGTPGFMSPEQLTGQRVSPASDVFSLGAVLTYTATGVGPFGTGTPDALHYRTVHEQPNLDSLAPELRDVVAACLAKKPNQRPTVATLLHRLTSSGSKDGSRQTSSPTLLLTEPGWMPDQIAQLVQENPPLLPETHPAAPGGSRRGTPGLKRWSLTYGKWRWWGGCVIEPRPSVAGGLVYVGSHDSKLYALDADAPVERWSFTTGGSVYSSPVVAHGVVYVGSQDRKLYALDAGTGQQRWSFTTGSSVVSSPAVAHGVVYVGSHDSKLYALEADTGHQRWSFTTGVGMGSSPAVAHGVVYVGSQDRKLYALDAGTGQQRWSFTTGSSVLSSPAVAHGVVYVGSHDSKLYALDASTGHLRWFFTTGGSVYSSPVVAHGVVYVGSQDRKVYALDADTGHQCWSFTMGRRPRLSPTVADGIVYVSSDNTLYALQT
ncbi:serine/threonine-protein kinase (plasmid) [Streptomyces sp. NBC_01232]|uniref:serine/threonine-protein kinase n=1 Tax=Streptomyces sp. NBC_01232 TaxID=2903786 RepID=UPI002E162FE6|nr:serine/threonine-protein kinase [Streptomyces sp. NBC_01232]